MDASIIVCVYHWMDIIVSCSDRNRNLINNYCNKLHSKQQYDHLDAYMQLIIIFSPLISVSLFECLFFTLVLFMCSSFAAAAEYLHFSIFLLLLASNQRHMLLYWKWRTVIWMSLEKCTQSCFMYKILLIKYYKECIWMDTTLIIAIFQCVTKFSSKNS